MSRTGIFRGRKPRFLWSVIGVLLLTRTLSAAEDVILTVNVKKPVAVTSDKFLSLTLDPAVLLSGDVLASSTEKSTNMARALAPAYVRLGGPRSNSYTFERALFPQDERSDPDFTFSEAHWVLVEQWAERSGLEVIACVAPQQTNNGAHPPTWDPRNALDLISFSDHMGYNTSWQLGYECQTRCDVPGGDLGKDVVRLRNMLDAFPRYSNSIIAGPDIVTFKSKPQQQYLQEYLNAAGSALSAITWHPEFVGITVDTDGAVSLHHDNLATEKDALFKVIGRSIAKRPLWIAESKPEECKRQFLGGLVWARRLGNAARLGIQVVMRQPDTSNLFHPTPDYWVSLLHKTLVGREVLDTKVTSGNKTHVHFYCQCTKPSAKYEKGSVTIFGLNLTPAKIVANLKGIKFKTIHKYILMPGFDAANRMFAESVLLNNEPLNLVNDKDLPDMNPVISTNGKSTVLKLPSGGIGFWVIPGIKLKICMGHEEDPADKVLLKKLTKRLEEADIEEDIGHEEEDGQEVEDDATAYLKQKKKKRKHRHSEEEIHEERKFGKIETKRELEKLEKFLRRNHIDDKKSLNLRGKAGLLMYDETNEKKENNSEEETIVQLKSAEKLESGEAIRAKLEEYKNRLIEYENRKKIQEETEQSLQKSRQAEETHDSKEVDTHKAVEALKLISKVENAMKNLNEDEARAKIETLNKEHSYDVASGQISSDNGEDVILDELLKSGKTKRMTIPIAEIGKKLSVIYRGLFEDQDPEETRSRAERTRFKRDLFGDDPLGLRRDGLFKKRSKNEDAKERRLERKNRKKEKEEARKDAQPALFDPKHPDSNENNFYGFAQRNPVKDFPQGDLFLSTGTSSEEKQTDYEYVDDDDDTPDRKNKPKGSKVVQKPQRKSAEPDDTWMEEDSDRLYHAPNEFFEDVKMPHVRIKENLKDYGELWEPESLQKAGNDNERRKGYENEKEAEEVIKEDYPSEVEDKRAKETAVKKLFKYYDNSKVSNTDYDDEKSEVPRGKSKAAEASTGKSGKPNPSPKNNNLQSKKRVKLIESEDEDDYEDFDSMTFRHSDESSANDRSLEETSVELAGKKKKRPKRWIYDLDSMFYDEMIYQDDENFRDCNCRVIRSDQPRPKRCKNKKCRNYRVGDARRSEEDSEESKESDDKKRRKRSAEDVEVKSVTQELFSNVQTATDAGDNISQTSSSPANAPPVENLPGHSTENFEEPSVKKIRMTAEESTTTQTINVDDQNTSKAESLEDNETYKANIKVTNVDEPELIRTFRESEVQHQEVEPYMQGEARSTEGSKTLALDRIPETREALIESTNSNLGSAPVTMTSSDVNIIRDTRDSRTDLLPSGSSTKIDRPNDIVGASEHSKANNLILKKDFADSGSNVNTIPVTNFVSSALPSHTQKEVPIVSTNLAESPKIAELPSYQGKTAYVEKSNDVEERSTYEVKAKDTEAQKALPKTEKTRAEPKLQAAKSGGLQSPVKKDKESKKMDAKTKALEASAKLKSTENARYQEYQKKRAEKLEKLKEKLKAKRAKILQQYREELLEALNKCNDEVERNLKKRQIWEDLTDREDFQDLVDQEKLAYIMTHKPIDYNSVIEESNSKNNANEMYFPEVEVTMPLRNVRRRKLEEQEKLSHHLRDPRLLRYPDFDFSSSQVDFKNSRDEEVPEEMNSLEHPDADHSYYAIVENLENPRIFPRDQLRNLQRWNDNEEYQEQPEGRLYQKKSYDYIPKNPLNNEDDVQNISNNRNYQVEFNEGNKNIPYSLGRGHIEKILQAVENNPYNLRDNGRYDNLRHLEHDVIENQYDYSYSDESLYSEEIMKGILTRPLLKLEPSNYRGGEPYLTTHQTDLHRKNLAEKPYSPLENLPEFFSEHIILDTNRRDHEKSKSQVAEVPEVNNYVSTEEKVSLNEKKLTSNNTEAKTYKQIDQKAVEKPKEMELKDPKLSKTVTKQSSLNNIEVKPRLKTEEMLYSKIEGSNNSNITSDYPEEMPPPNVRNRRNVKESEEVALNRQPFLPMRRSSRTGRQVKKERCNYMCLKENSNEASNEDKEQLYKLIKEEDHYKAVPVLDIKEKHGSKKKNLKTLEYDEDTRYGEAKYTKQSLSDEVYKPYEQNYLTRKMSLMRETEDPPKRYYEEENGNAWIRRHDSLDPYRQQPRTRESRLRKHAVTHAPEEINRQLDSLRGIPDEENSEFSYRNNHQNNRASLRKSIPDRMYDDDDFWYKHQNLLVDLPRRYSKVMLLDQKHNDKYKRFDYDHLNSIRDVPSEERENRYGKMYDDEDFSRKHESFLIDPPRQCTGNIDGKVTEHKTNDKGQRLENNPASLPEEVLNEENKEFDREQEKDRESNRVSLTESIPAHYGRMYDDGDFLRKHGEVLVHLPGQYSNDVQMKLIGQKKSDKYKEIESEETFDSQSPGDELDSKYELMMLVPMKSRRIGRKKRQVEDEPMENEITKTPMDDDEERDDDGWEDEDEMNQVWQDIVDTKRSEQLLQDYVANKQRYLKEFEMAKKNLNDYLKKVKEENFKKEKQWEEMVSNINLGKPGDAASSIERDKAMLGLYLKDEILKTTRIPESEEINNGESLETKHRLNGKESILLSEMDSPKNEDDVTKKMNVVENLTDSLETFIDEFGEKFNGTLKKEEESKKKSQYSIFHRALDNVKKFFDFLSGIAFIFHRH